MQVKSLVLKNNSELYKDVSSLFINKTKFFILLSCCIHIEKVVKKIKGGRVFFKKIIDRIFIKNKDKPDLLFVEPTNACNLDCPFCLVNTDSSYGNSCHSSMKRKVGFMEMTLFLKILKDAKEFGIKKIFLQFWGNLFCILVWVI